MQECVPCQQELTGPHVLCAVCALELAEVCGHHRIMEFWSFVCDQLSEVQFEACNLCSLEPPINPVVTACDHCFCWPCMQQFLQVQAKTCPVCSTMLSSDSNVVPTFDTQGALVLHLPTADEVEHSWDDDMLEWSNTAAFAPAVPRFGGGAQCEERS